MAKRVIISGGGTGGHVFPAIAIGRALKARNEEIEILFVGAKGKLEMQKVPKAGFDIIGLWISGFHRHLTIRNLLFPFKLLWSMIHSFFILRRFRPDVVIGVGGYASGAIMKMAGWLGIPYMIQEQNSYAGVTNKLVASDAEAVCVAYDKMEEYFPKEKIRFTGNPVRKDILNLGRGLKEARSYFDLDPEKKTILVVGGSLGARSINDAISHGLKTIQLDPDIQILWQCGSLYHDEFKDRTSAQVKVRAFLDRMDLAYIAADLIISRAGASTVSELCMIGKAAIMVPSPNVAEDHQTKNANSIADHDGALVIRDSEAKAILLMTALDLLKDEKRCHELGQSIKALGKPNATAAIVEVAMEIMNRTSK
ncbi:MAG: undecaprenyldiphospho-muramoylpentapeptide beta-N-acetylglucosaminyltransferase [Bacteroidia bacterium]|nr:undecaprenyldiphospho-muramoylpentapeptide beta-N-acetylglucosaminyltransferase [Bacteroidia bacterium]